MKYKSPNVIEAVIYMGAQGLMYGAGTGAAYGTVFAPISGTIYGGFFGGLIGLPLGIIGGIITDIVTAMFFALSSNQRIYRRTLQILGGLMGFSGAFIGLLLQFSLYSVAPLNIGELISDSGIFFYIIPALIAAGCATYVSDNYVEEYLKHQPKPQSQVGQTTTIEVHNHD